MSKTLQGKAQEYLGKAEEFGKLLDFNPEYIPFQMPPQIEMGLKVAKQVSDLTGVDVKIPTSEEIKKMATGEISKVLGGLGESSELLKQAKSTLEGVQGATEVFKGLDGLLGGSSGATGSEGVQDILSSIQWLF